MSETREKLLAGVRHAFIVENWKPITRNSLRGFCTTILPSGMVLSDVSVHVDHGKAWASPPSRPMISSQGTVLRDQNGRVRYVAVVSFASRQLRDRFSNGVIEALKAAYPDALA